MSFNECESSMYPSRRKLQPKIPQTNAELILTLPETTLAIHYRFSISTNNQTAVVLYSNQKMNCLSELDRVQCD